MIFLNEEQIKKTNAIIKLGLEEAAKSLAYFTKTETKLKLCGEFTVNNSSSAKIKADKSGNLYLLTTEIMGDMKGVAYLLFSEEEVTTLMKLTYPDKEFPEDKYEKKSKGLLLEVDNIITASMVSQFANHFGFRTYGGVPTLAITNPEELKTIIEKSLVSNEFVLDFKAQLIAEDVNLNADFVWFVDHNFIEGVKKANNI